ncbi:MAG: DUF1361 domain-containing protein [Leptolyngbya foveolarum]|uniref:DUF1361 domain-containing protein n=1 Tax=Leptolyngbya foveolarum TaxID=47253 RepID=A0A2W4WPG3_9CYAN|nr:MAG: DUF1361 domain-containing protein [Leptolyngbya foveolarum]
MFLRTVLRDLSIAFSSVYSGWILWNLFLAFIPLFLSYILFRRKDLSPTKIWGALVVMSVVGTVGLWPRLPRVLGAQMQMMNALVSGDRTAQLKLIWWIALAALSLTLSLSLFQREKSRRTAIWWLSLIAFIAFLPNAPYVLTDIIHLIRATSSGVLRTWVVALVLIPLHTVAILLGFEAYVIALINQAHYLKQKGNQRFILQTELLFHALSAIGIYLGRFVRLNSWDLATDPTSVALTTLNALTTKRPAAVVFVTFIILTVLYWVMKQITLGIKLRIYYSRKGIDALDL